MGPGIESRRLLPSLNMSVGGYCQVIIVTMATVVFSSTFAMQLAVSSASQGKNKPSMTSQNTPIPSTSLGLTTRPTVPTNFVASSLISRSQDTALFFDEDNRENEEEKQVAVNTDIINFTLSDHTFQQLLQSSQYNGESQSNPFLVKLSSYLFNNNIQEKYIKNLNDPIKISTSQSLSLNSPNPPRTIIPKPFVHSTEKYPPFKDYLRPLQFHSSLNEHETHNNGEFPGVKDITTKEPSTTSLYLNWDKESEQELQSEKDTNLTITKPMWFLLALSGNATLAKLRRDDFIKYVRVNVASRLSMQYDEVQVIRLQLSPRILMNVSIASSRKPSVMSFLAANAAPLLELSGEEYIITPLEDSATAEHQTGVVPTSPEGSQDDLEAAVCVLAGGACALAVGAALLVAALVRRQRPRNDLPTNRVETLCLPPAVIYTGRLESGECKVIQNTSTNTKPSTIMDPRVQPNTLPLDARFVEELGLDNPNFLTP